MNIMMDIETLGTRPGCAILSIAAVPFATPFDIEPFYVKIDSTTCTENGFHVDDATIAWWSKQNLDAYNEAFSGTMDIRVALLEFAEYLHHLPTAPLIWGNGASFDNVLMSEAFKILGMKQPWKYADDRCYRTLKALYPQIPYIKPTIAHNALQDAKAQAAHATRIFAFTAERGR